MSLFDLPVDVIDWLVRDEMRRAFSSPRVDQNALRTGLVGTCSWLQQRALDVLNEPGDMYYDALSKIGLEAIQAQGVVPFLRVSVREPDSQSVVGFEFAEKVLGTGDWVSYLRRDLLCLRVVSRRSTDGTEAKAIPVDLDQLKRFTKLSSLELEGRIKFGTQCCEQQWPCLRRLICMECIPPFLSMPVLYSRLEILKITSVRDQTETGELLRAVEGATELKHLTIFVSQSSDLALRSDLSVPSWSRMLMALTKMETLNLKLIPLREQQWTQTLDFGFVAFMPALTELTVDAGDSKPMDLASLRQISSAPRLQRLELGPVKGSVHRTLVSRYFPALTSLHLRGAKPRRWPEFGERSPELDWSFFCSAELTLTELTISSNAYEEKELVDFVKAFTCAPHLRRVDLAPAVGRIDHMFTTSKFPALKSLTLSGPSPWPGASNSQLTFGPVERDDFPELESLCLSSATIDFNGRTEWARRCQSIVLIDSVTSEPINIFEPLAQYTKLVTLFL